MERTSRYGALSTRSALNRLTDLAPQGKFVTVDPVESAVKIPKTNERLASTICVSRNMTEEEPTERPCSGFCAMDVNSLEAN